MNKLAIVCGVLAGCTYGGSNEDPRVEVDAPEAVSPGAMDASTSSDSDESTPPGMKDARAPSVSTDASTPHADAKVVHDNCEPSAPIATCDPVRNTGCPPLTQCDIDTEATTPTGRCVFYQLSLDSTMCSSSFLDTSCDAQFTCVANACRQMCYCDSDCPNGQRCNDSSGPGPQGAFKLCSP